MTVFFEALPALDHGRGTETPFQLLGAPGLRGEDFCAAAATYDLPGVEFAPHRYAAASGVYKGQEVGGVRINVSKPELLQPVRLGVSLIRVLQELRGVAGVWSPPGTRPEFFDKLMGTDTVRTDLQANLPVSRIVGRWEVAAESFRKSRASCLAYP
jgi:uncharacterized protein YbbC (DUF1343 family)